MNDRRPFVPNPSWHWRNCRSIGIRFDFWLWPWSLGVYRDEDLYGGERWIYIGPICIGVAYSIGNASSSGPDRFTALSESDAFVRAAKYEERT